MFEWRHCVHFVCEPQSIYIRIKTKLSIRYHRNETFGRRRYSVTCSWSTEQTFRVITASLFLNWSFPKTGFFWKLTLLWHRPWPAFRVIGSLEIFYVSNNNAENHSGELITDLKRWDDIRIFFHISYGVSYEKNRTTSRFAHGIISKKSSSSISQLTGNATDQSTIYVRSSNPYVYKLSIFKISRSDF